jgi:transcriptional regulator with XRE-family HTH domain
MTIILKDRLRELMSRKKINAAEIERRTGLNRNTVYSILGGNSKSPSMHNLQLLAKALNINLEVLTGNKEEDDSFEILTASQVKIFADITNMMTQTIIE